MRCGMVRAQAGAEDRGLSPVRTSNVGTSNLGVGVGEEVPSFYFLSLSLTLSLSLSLSLSARPRTDRARRSGNAGLAHSYHNQ